jgi:CBS-domain-containing membrane protein
MATLAKILGALAGIVIAVVFTEVIFSNNQEWPIIFVGVGAALGWLIVGALLGLRASDAPDPRSS